MVKRCAKCRKGINEEREKFCMLITKKDGRILEFESFHFDCWKSFFAGAVMMKVGEVFGN